MVTILFILVLFSQIVMSAIVDSFYYNIPILESFLTVLSPEPGTRKTIVFISVFVALIVAAIIDYRVKKGKESSKQGKQSQKQIEGKQS